MTYREMYARLGELIDLSKSRLAVFFKLDRRFSGSKKLESRKVDALVSGASRRCAVG